MSYRRMGGRSCWPVAWRSLLALCVAGPACLAELSFSATGSLAVRTFEAGGKSAPWGKSSLTNWFTLRRDACAFVLRAGATSPEIEYIEYGTFGGDTYELVLYREEHLPPTSVNRANLKLFPGQMPEEALGFVGPVWIAMASGCYFRTNTNESLLPPIPNYGVISARFRELDGKLPTLWAFDQSAPGFLEFLAQLNLGEEYSPGPSGTMRVRRAPRFQGQTNLSFRVTEWGECQLGRYPRRFEMQRFVSSADRRGMELFQEIQGTIDQIGPSGEGRSYREAFPENTMVYDRRLRFEGARVPTISYLATNGIIREVAELQGTSLFDDAIVQLEYRKTLEKRSQPWLVILVAVALLLPPLLLLLGMRRARRQQPAT